MPSTHPRSSPNMPPMMKWPPPGTQTCDRYGHVIATLPAPRPQAPMVTGPRAPTSNRYGQIIDRGEK